MRVDRLELTDFTVFERAEFEFSPGLNVLIGANGTGKSHVLKVLYSVTRAMASMGVVARDNPESDVREILGDPILDTLEKTFRPEPDALLLTALIRRGAEKSEVTVRGSFGTAAVRFGGEDTTADFAAFVPPMHEYAVFVPASEVLSMYPGFVAAYERKELSFDGTFRDLCLDLSASPLRSIDPPALADLVAKLDEAVGGKTVLVGNRFYVSLSEDWLLGAPMLAEGLRKLAAITHLIRNDSLAQNGVLFWDEPETNMNPKLIPTVAQALMGLAAAGIQVFVATHDYLLSNELSLAAEYQTDEGKAANIRFFCLGRDQSSEPVRIASGATLAEIPENPILQEFAAHYDRERSLLYGPGSLQSPEPKK